MQYVWCYKTYATDWLPGVELIGMVLPIPDHQSVHPIYTIFIIIIIILFKSGNKAHKYKQGTYRQTDRQYK